jgi:hypothetical protein
MAAATSTTDVVASEEGVYAWSVTDLGAIKAILSSLRGQIEGYHSDYNDNYKVMQENYKDDINGESNSEALFALMEADVSSLELLIADFDTLIEAINEVMDIYEKGDKEVEAKCEDVETNVKDALKLV